MESRESFIRFAVCVSVAGSAIRISLGTVEGGSMKTRLIDVLEAE